MTPVEFKAVINSYNELREADIKHDYELARFNSWINLAPYIKNKSQEDLFRFPWEEIKKGKVLNGTTNAISKTKSSARRGE